MYGLLLSAALAVANPVPAYAQETLEFSVASTDPTRAIHDFGDQARLQIIAPTEELAGKRLHEVTGLYSIEAGLNTLLDGTGLTHKYVGERTVALVKNDATDTADAGEETFWNRFRLAQTDIEPRQSASQPPSATESSGTRLEEIVVTAQKREERLLDVPISIVALSDTDLQRRKITRLEDLAFAVPGLAIQNNGGFQRRIVLRGISNVFGNSSLIGMYLDEVSVTSAPTSQLDLRTYDLERVEVLRGPQGTLYGEGSVGGTIRFITRDPALDRFAMKADVAALFTEDGGPSQRIEGAVNIPIVADVLGLRIAGTFDHEGGWIEQPAASRKNYNEQNLANVRIKGLWKPTAELAVNAMAVIHRNDAPPSTGEDRDGNFTQNFGLTVSPAADDDYDLYNLTLTYDFAGARLLSSSSSIKQDKLATYSLRIPFDPSGTPYLGIYVPQSPREGDIRNQELRLTSTGSGPWQWTVGGFYRHARFIDDLPQAFYAVPGPPGSPLPPSFAYVERRLSKSWAAFGDMSYKVAQRLTLGAGLRYFEDDQEFSSEFDGAAGPLLSGKFHSLNPRVYAQYGLTDQVNVYASAAKGFRSGGFNAQGQPNYDPESVWTYEVGTKASLAEGRFTTELAVFYSDYSDYQINGIPPPPAVPLGLATNAGDAEIKGIEWGFSWRPAPAWLLSFNGNYLDSEFTKIAATSTSHIVGDRLDLSPRYGFTVSTEREFNWNGRSGYARLDYDQHGRATYRNRASGPWYFSESDVIDLLNFNLSVQMNQSLTLGVFAQNLLNDRGQVDPFGIETYAARMRPRTYGVQFGVSFD